MITAFVESTMPPEQTDFEEFVEGIDVYCTGSDSLADFKRLQKCIFVESNSTKNVGKVVR